MVNKKKKEKKLVIILIVITSLIIIAATTVFFIVKTKSNSDSNKPGLNVIVTQSSSVEEGSGFSKVNNYNFKLSKGLLINFPSVIASDGKGFIVSDVSDSNITITLPNGIIATDKREGLSLFESPSPNNLIVQKNGNKSEACTQSTDAGSCFKFYYIQ